MARGRRAKGPGLVEHLDGSDLARSKLRIVLETISGKKSIEAACQELGIGNTAFHELRAKILKGAIELLEPRPPGRPPQPSSPSSDRVAELEAEVRRLKTELDIAYVREEVILAMPGIFKPAKTGRKKKRGRKIRSKASPPGDAAPHAGALDLSGEGQAKDETARRRDSGAAT